MVFDRIWQLLKPDKDRELLRETFGRQKTAKTYSEWLEASQELDRLLGNDQWKQKRESGLYHYDVVEYRLNQLRRAREHGDMDNVMYLLRTTLQRNLGNMGDLKLYSNSYTGTKTLIEEYIEECETSLETLMSSPEVDDSVLLSSLIQTRKAFGRTALVLSGGSTFGILHIGVIKELLHQNLLPRIISGASAGSIFASILCIHMDEEIDNLLKSPIFQEDFNIFEQNGNEEKTMDRLARFLKFGTWFDNKYLSQTMRELLGDLTFQEAYYRSRRVLNIPVTSASIHEMPRLLNYLTAPNVLIWSAVCASCSVPLIFASYDIRAKNPKTGEHYSWNPSTFIDGSVNDDLPLARLSEMFNVNHFIACQVNPHIVPFIHLNETISSFDHDEKDDTKWRDMWQSAQTLLRNEISHYLQMVSEFGLFENATSKLRSMLAQQYSGDITILPQILISELGQLFKNPTSEFFVNAQLRAAQATWPKMSVIRNHCAIELALDKSIHQLKGRLIPDATEDHYSNTIKPKRQYHQRRKSDGLAVKYLVRRNSWQEFGHHHHNKSSSLVFRTLPPSRRSSVSHQSLTQLTSR